MAIHNGKGKDIEPGLVARVAQGLRYVVTGKDWFGPSTPMAPVAPEEAKARAFDYQVGVNLTSKPRSNEPMGFPELRQVADAYDLLRLAIETRKDQLSRMNWTVRPSDKNKKSDARCAELIKFFKKPNREHDFSTWMRALMEDHLVLDGIAIYPRKTKGGQVMALELIDASTINRLVGYDGRTPMPPDAAYQQILKGLPATEYTLDELIYAVRNVRTHKLYGYSPVEQVVMTVNIALRRQMHQLQYYTEGNIPEALISVPDSWGPDQVAQFQMYWDSIMEGDTASRRHAKFVPGGMNISETKTVELKDMFDEWLARIVFFAFSLSPSGLVKDQNRATAESQKSSAKEEGLESTAAWLESLLTRVIEEVFGFDDLCFVFKEETDEDPLIQAQINQIYIEAGVKTPNEVRSELGLEPIVDESMDRTVPMSAQAIADSTGGQEFDEQGNPIEPGAQESDGTQSKDGPAKKNPKLPIGKSMSVHLHMPAPVVKFEPVIDVQSPVINIEGVSKFSKRSDHGYGQQVKES